MKCKKDIWCSVTEGNWQVEQELIEIQQEKWKNHSMFVNNCDSELIKYFDVILQNNHAPQTIWKGSNDSIYLINK